MRYTEVAPDGVAEMRGLEHYLNAGTALPAVLLEMVRLRVSLLNGCPFCIGHHTKELQKHNEPQSRLRALEDWAASPDAFTARERHALAWADAVTNIQNGHADAAEYEAVSAYFGSKDLVDLTLAVASINAWNRMSIAFKAEWQPSRGKAQERADPEIIPKEYPTHDGPGAMAPNGASASDRLDPAAANGSSSGNRTSEPRQRETPARVGWAAEAVPTPSSTGTASSPRETTPAHPDASTEDVVDDDGGKVAHD